MLAGWGSTGLGLPELLVLYTELGLVRLGTAMSLGGGGAGAMGRLARDLESFSAFPLAFFPLSLTPPFLSIKPSASSLGISTVELRSGTMQFSSTTVMLEMMGRLLRSSMSPSRSSEVLLVLAVSVLRSSLRFFGEPTVVTL